MIFTLGILIGSIAATAWANLPSTSPSNIPVAQSPMSPFGTMSSASNLPEQERADMF